jgi:hypothetical protein
MLRTGGVSGAHLDSHASPGGVAEPVRHRQLRGPGWAATGRSAPPDPAAVGNRAG